MNEKIQNILTEIESVIVGKNENVEKILMAILAQGHVLMAVSYTHLDVYKRQVPLREAEGL